MAGKQERSETPSYVGTLRDINKANTSSMTKHWVCPNTQFCCVCVFLGILLKLILKLDSSC